MGALLYQTLRESIVDAIRSKIFNHEIKPGQRIVELELAKEFHTSRGPIREALRQLENEGIIVYARNVGCSVKELSFQDSYEVYLLRTNYEVVSVRFLQGKIPEKSMQHLEEILKRMKNLTAEEFDQVFECDNEFHEELVKMCGMPRVQKAWKEQDMIWCRTKKLSQNGSMHRIRSFMMHVWQEIVRQSVKPSKAITGEPSVK